MQKPAPQKQSETARSPAPIRFSNRGSQALISRALSQDHNDYNKNGWEIRAFLQKREARARSDGAALR